ncbi:hypothetical protein BCR34DRAFT_627348 [Clohesyomyces aquaticus]|uniref:Male sterility protein-domain-containing protein n=1 Tax=Clohesyomyces aquaticus TaxID=1231657 RepID=A0A1Y1Z0I3_9PLEO|nr:hypothetical protein BCR34DRAFT_627348 [Clohesyomyces aquaticus]
MDARGAKHERTLIHTVDTLIHHRARTNPRDPIVSYPSANIDFVDYSLQQLDMFAPSSVMKPTVVALLGPSNFDHLITMLALTKLGHIVLFLSPRITQLAIESRLQSTGASYLLTESRFHQTASCVRNNVADIEIGEIAGRNVHDFPIESNPNTQMDHYLDPNIETLNTVFIIHSSGHSTGLPKPIQQTHKSALANYAINMNMMPFITLLLYYNHGICNFFRAIYSGKRIHLYNADLPLAQPHLIRILKAHKFEIFSSCLTRLLVDRGVKLVGYYGATEVSQLITSFRPDGDQAWNYIQETEKLKPFLKWIPRDPNLIERTILGGWPSKVASNMSDGSYATKGLFEPHPTIPGVWKYDARLDNTIALMNGEKYNPVMMEGRIRSHRAVTEAIFFGTGRPYLAVLVINDRILLAYARRSRDMITVLQHDCEFPRTDQGSISEYLKAFSVEELEAFLRGILAKSITEALDIDKDTDFLFLGTRLFLLYSDAHRYPEISQHWQPRPGSECDCRGAHFSVQPSAQLAIRPDIDIAQVHCLVRARDHHEATHRVRRSLMQRKILHTLPLAARSKIIALPSQLSDPHLGLSEHTYTEITKHLRNAVHCAWSVNFNLSLSTFENDCITDVRHRIDLCHAVPEPQPASFNFCSSVSTVARCPYPEATETLPELPWAQDMGYAQSKLVVEHLCMRAGAATGIRGRVLRIGHIVADTVHGVWTVNESISILMQTALIIGALPKLQESLSVIEIALSDAGAVVANIANARTFRLRVSNLDPGVNPPIKLLECFVGKYGRDGPVPAWRFKMAHRDQLRKIPSIDTEVLFVEVKYDTYALAMIQKLRKENFTSSGALEAQVGIHERPGFSEDDVLAVDGLMSVENVVDDIVWLIEQYAVFFPRMEA